MADEINLQDWIKAGKLTAEVRSYGASLIKKGASYKEITEKIEEKIKSLGAVPAFPPQMALNEVAAHFTLDPDEDIILNDELVCLDLGVSVNGAIGDSAISVDLSGKHQDLIDAAEDALQQAVKALQEGTFALGKIGGVIHDTIAKHGFKPIRNLSGHGLGINEIHLPPTVPNFDTGDTTELEPESFFAIEPFATNGAGIIYETENANIYSVIKKKPVRSPITRQVLKEIETYEGRPFATRLLAKKFPLFKVNFALKELLHAGAIQAHPPLIDKDKGMVSQAEHSIYLDKDRKVTILTKE